MKNPFIKILAIVAIVFFFIGLNEGMAQPPGLPGSSNGGTGVDDSGVPINGLLTIVLVLGAWFGARKIKGRK